MEKIHRSIVNFGVSTEKRKLPSNHLVSSLPPHQWKEMTLTDLPTNLVLQNQGSASDCGANGPKKMINLQTNGELIVSCHPFYARRSNNPEPGMSLDDILNIPCTNGTCLESEDPSDEKTEEELNMPVTVATPIKGSNPIELDVTDIEMLASYYDAYGGLIFTFNIAWEEWDTESGVPKYIPGSLLAGGHCEGGGIPAIYNESKGFFVQGSWGKDNDSIQNTSWVFLSEDFLKNRGTGAGTFNAPSMTTNSQDLFSSTLRLGSQGTDVVKLQTILGIKSDGIFGPKTEAEVMLFQTLHDLVPDGIVGKLTMAILSTIQVPEKLIEPINIEIIRNFNDEKETLGTLSINGSIFVCKTLEPVNPIPTGTYECLWSFQKDLNEWHYELQNVPGHTGVFIHEGNYYSDTEGCILLGLTEEDINSDGELDITSSRATLAQFQTLTNKMPLILNIS